MLEGQFRLAMLDVPELDQVVAGGAGKDVLGRGVPNDVSDFSERASVRLRQSYRGQLPGVSGQPGCGSDILRLLSVGVEGEILRHLPEEDLPTNQYPGTLVSEGGPVIPCRRRNRTRSHYH